MLVPGTGGAGRAGGEQQGRSPANISLFSSSVSVKEGPDRGPLLSRTRKLGKTSSAVVTGVCRISEVSLLRTGVEAKADTQHLQKLSFFPHGSS